MDTTKAQALLDKVNVQLLLASNTTFYTTILFSLNRTWKTDIPTAGTDGVNLFINPTWFEKLSVDQAQGLMIHEVNHIALNHIERCGERNHKKFNRAADFAINLPLIDEGWKLPDDGCIDEQYRDMSTDEIYELLEDEDDDYDCDILPGNKELSEDEKQAIQHKIQETIAKAVQASKIDGSWDSLPDELRKNVDTLLEVKLDWKTILANHMTNYAKDDYSMRKPNRRFLHMDMYMPSLYSESIADVNVGIDTSGSITEKVFIELLSEVNGIQERLKPSTISVCQWNHTVTRTDDISLDETVQDIPLGNTGGTEVNCWLDTIRGKHLEFAICMTDGYWADTPNFNNITCPIYWILFDNNNKNFKVEQGEVIHY